MISEIEPILKKFSHRMRVAIAASASARALPVYSASYRQNVEVFETAIEIVWDYAEGAGIEAEILMNTREQIEEKIPRVDEDYEYIPALNSGAAVIYAVDAVTDVSCHSTLCALAASIKAITAYSDEPDEAEQAELDWLDKVLARAEKSAPKKIKKGMFENL